jgi:small conductance mechanosensitive channel
VTAWLSLPAGLTAPAPNISPTPNCVGTNGVCQWVFDVTGNRWLASGSYWFLVKPVSILVIVIVAMIARWLLHRAIDRLVRTTSDGAVPTILRPLKERLPRGGPRPATPPTSTALVPERRRQRAAAIGSVLRSFATTAVFSIAALMILNELGFDLAPLLASAGIAGVALGFGAQTLVKDLIAGLFMLLEDQYGVGDIVDLGQATGSVESVGLRITTIRDARGVLWYIRNGEIIRVGNRSQGWAVVMVDITVDFAQVDQASGVLQAAAAGMAADPEWADDMIEPPEMLGVEQITIDGAMLRTTAKTSAQAQFRLGRELRRRLTEALAEAGINSQVPVGRLSIQPAVSGATGEGAPTVDGDEVTDGAGTDGEAESAQQDGGHGGERRPSGTGDE